MNINHLTNSIESPKLNWRGLFHSSGGLSKHQWILLIVFIIILIVLAFAIGKYFEKKKGKIYETVQNATNIMPSTTSSEEDETTSQKKWYHK